MAIVANDEPRTRTQPQWHLYDFIDRTLNDDANAQDNEFQHYSLRYLLLLCANLNTLYFIEARTRMSQRLLQLQENVKHESAQPPAFVIDESTLYRNRILVWKKQPF